MHVFWHSGTSIRCAKTHSCINSPASGDEPNVSEKVEVYIHLTKIEKTSSVVARSFGSLIEVITDGSFTHTSTPDFV